MAEASNNSNSIDSDAESDGFYFESDHMPLRGNQDYSNVLRTIALLESCKLRIHAQIQELEHANTLYAANPEVLLMKIKNNEEIVPKQGEIQIPQIPALIGTYEFLKPPKSFIKEESNHDEVKPTTVRGRVFDETKPETFNKLWTCEEQRRLEQLLIEFPPEKNEMRRYTKIAQALGDRTPQQVCSRVQKFFKKLCDAGMPIPGRKPKNRRATYGKMKYMNRPSTFFPSYNVRVNMPEDDEFDNEEWRSSMQTQSITMKLEHDYDQADDDDNNDDDTVTNDGCISPAYIEGKDIKKHREKILYILKELRDEKEQCGETYQPDPMAPLCDNCRISAVTLKHWHCRTCHIYLRQCADCIITKLTTDDFRHIAHDIVAED